VLVLSVNITRIFYYYNADQIEKSENLNLLNRSSCSWII